MKALTAAVSVALIATGCGNEPDAELARPEPTTEPNISPADVKEPVEEVTSTTEPEPTTTVTSSPPQRPTTSLVVLPGPTTARDVLPEYSGPVSDIEWLVRETFPEDPDRAARIADCESDFEPYKTGAEGERGVMQIHPVHKARIARMGYSWDDMYTVLPNLAVARALYDESGWGPWSCR